ncbi:MAG: hypothetical protein J0I16_02785 [Rhizobiales bacterium]|nr:hypothetical protein [Hyphomicrobiales bacterium]
MLTTLRTGLTNWIATKRGDAEHDAADGARWRRFGKALFGTFIGGLAACAAFILIVDPYQVVPFSPPMPRPNIDTSQRHFYPAIIRHGNYDSIIVGNSMIRLFDPDRLDKTFGSRLANVAMNAATPWEQMQMADLFLRVKGPPKVMIVGLDHWWCDERADQPDRKLTIRAFPDWMFDDNPWNDFLYLLNGKTIETAARIVMTNLGHGRIRLQPNGFSVYTPPDDTYDLAAAQQRIWGDRPHVITPVTPPVVLTEAERATLRFPAQDWLDAILNREGDRTRTVLIWLPTHISTLPAPGSRDAAVEAACKADMDAIARRHQATVVDWRIDSPLNRNDATFWDPYHHRLPVAQRIEDDLAKALAGKDAADDGAWTVRVRGR